MIRRAKDIGAYYRHNWRQERDYGWQFVWVDIRWIVTGRETFL